MHQGTNIGSGKHIEAGLYRSGSKTNILGIRCKLIVVKGSRSSGSLAVSGEFQLRVQRIILRIGRLWRNGCGSRGSKLYLSDIPVSSCRILKVTVNGTVYQGDFLYFGAVTRTAVPVNKVYAQVFRPV